MSSVILIAAIIVLGFIIFGNTGVALIRKLNPIQAAARIDIGDHTHAKRSVPSTGGIMILATSFLGSLLVNDMKLIWPVWLLLFSFFAIGLVDDITKVYSKSKYGLKGKTRLILELIFSMIFLYILHKQHPEYITTSWRISNNFNINLGFLFWPLGALVISGAANAVNLTDGLDGLAIGTVQISLIFFLCISSYLLSSGVIQYHDIAQYVVGLLPHSLNKVADSWLNSAKISSIDLIIEARKLCIIFSGCCLGFLWLNSKPARIFMGDCGSLLLGGLLGTLAVIFRVELLLPIVGIVFVIETISVILQVAYFKITKGKRIFKCTPIHHHYEMLGNPEEKIVVRFWILGALGMLFGLYLYFL